MESDVSFPGLTSITRGEMTVSRGVLPNVGLLRIMPQEDLRLQAGNLVFRHGSQRITFPDVLPRTPHLRKVETTQGHRWELEVVDRRRHWSSKTLNGRYNVRLRDGRVDPATRKTPGELAQLLLTALGESNFDVSAMPTGVFPPANWPPGTRADLALAALCRYVGCEVTGGELGRVKIVRLGQGASLPSANATHPQWNTVSQLRPSRIVLKCGPTIVQSKLKLAAVALERDGRTVPVDQASYRPGNGWGGESPFALTGVSASDRPLAKASVWRWYRIKEQAQGGLGVPALPIPIVKADQYLPLLEELIEGGEDPDGVRRPLRPYIEGTYWPYGDAGANTQPFTRFLGAWELEPEAGRVVFAHPQFTIDNSAQIAEAALYLTCAYAVRNPQGQVAFREFTRSLGGSGGDVVLLRPELFESVLVRYQDQSTTVSGTQTNTQELANEANAYLDIFAALYNGSEFEEQTYIGLPGIWVDGKIAQVKVACGFSVGFQFRASTGAEFDIYSPSAAERRRREVVARLEERL